MKAAVLHAPGDIRIENVTNPKIKENEVLVQIYSCGICGTDFHVYKGEREVQLPLIQGHEIAGKVVEIGKNVSKNLLNERVTIEPNFTCGKCFFCKTGRYNLCRNRQTLGLTIPGGFCEYVAVPQEYVWKMSENISYDEGAIVEPLTVGFHAVERANIRLGQRVVVFGLGIIGLSIVQCAKHAGAQVCAVDLVESRLELAKNLGADKTLNASIGEVILESDINEWSKGYIDVTFEAVGVPAVQEHALRMVRPGGKVILVGQSASPMKLSSLFVTRREIEIIGSLACLLDFPIVIEMLDRGVIKGKPLITHRFKLEEVKKAYEMIENKEAIKVVLQCQS